MILGMVGMMRVGRMGVGMRMGIMRILELVRGRQREVVIVRGSDRGGGGGGQGHISAVRLWSKEHTLVTVRDGSGLIKDRVLVIVMVIRMDIVILGSKGWLWLGKVVRMRMGVRIMVRAVEVVVSLVGNLFKAHFLFLAEKFICNWLGSVFSRSQFCISFGISFFLCLYGNKSGVWLCLCL
jgi:hypothetical protein